MLKIKNIYIDSGKLTENIQNCIIDTEEPVFSWAVSSTNSDNEQTACRVTVSSENSVMWDSGWTEQKEQSMNYKGPRLPHGKEILLSVQIRDRFREESEVQSAKFVSGLLDKNELSGKWITSPQPNDRKVLCFRKDIRLKEIPTEACLYVCGLGYHHVTVNGKEITDARLEPAHSNYAKVVYYSVYPQITQALANGKNIICTEVADGWRNNETEMTRNAIAPRTPEFFGKTQLWAMLVLTYADGHKETISTNESWMVGWGAKTHAHIFDGETYDARKSVPEWNISDRIPEDFTTSVVTEAPGGEMRPMVLEPIRITEEYSAQEITMPKQGLFVADFGQNIAGAVRVKLPKHMKKGQVITLRFAEELDEDGTPYSATYRDAKATDRYIASGDEHDLTEWLPTFTFHGFRYCSVEGLDFIFKEDITACLMHTDIKNESLFSCGSALVNQIQKNIVMTERDNMHSILTDCPQRDERMGWMNDATVRFEETPYNFNIGRMFPKIVRDIQAEQIDGAFSCCCPRYFGILPADPVCSSYLVAAYQAWMHTGNVKLIEESIDGLAAWEDFLIKRSDGYIVNYSYYGDWAAPGYACEGGDEGAKNTETEGILMSTGYSYYNCQLLVKMAEAIGRKDIAEKYTDIGNKVQEAFLKKWFDPQTNTVGIGSQGAHAFALWLDILPKDARQVVADHMAEDLVNRNYKFTTGNLCTRYMFDMLAKYGHKDVAWTLLNKETYPSYGYMIQNEATTIWERFELKKSIGMNSHNHPMYSAVGYFFYAYLAGITPMSAGWETVRIAPVMPEGLTSVHAVVDTVKGDISIRLSERYEKKRLFVDIPFGVTANIEFCGISKTVGSGYHVFEV